MEAESKRPLNLSLGSTAVGLSAFGCLTAAVSRFSLDDENLAAVVDYGALPPGSTSRSTAVGHSWPPLARRDGPVRGGPGRRPGDIDTR